MPDENTVGPDPSVPSLEEMQAECEQLLGRPVEILEVSMGESTLFMADYFNYGAPATKLCAQTSDDALVALWCYLRDNPPTET